LIHVRRGAARPSSPLPPDGTIYIQSGVGDGGGSNTKAQRSLGWSASILARNRNVPTAVWLHMASARVMRI